ncbi:MAG: hypothetical protein WAL05_02640 [Candidatus Sulfotelmatobacter sp.]
MFHSFPMWHMRSRSRSFHNLNAALEVLRHTKAEYVLRLPNVAHAHSVTVIPNLIAALEALRHPKAEYVLQLPNLAHGHSVNRAAGQLRLDPA